MHHNGNREDGVNQTGDNRDIVISVPAEMQSTLNREGHVAAVMPCTHPDHLHARGYWSALSAAGVGERGITGEYYGAGVWKADGGLEN
jgi:hypothetical protein